ncbi:fumarate reductase flavoprotein subunit [Aspergillus sclerotialis]|uniref:Fumarate reductase flavoprotein subunit n=1 Tax=Aspergillus sclerotialis TaxID=2070753 RepID=A0A3A2ZE88_9EURO|nr:fumarate reductase flavoprotein subunit [Aspergillus sclerotialis]
MSPPAECDILIIGSGNAGFSAAISAAQASQSHKQKPRILLIDKCPPEWAGGNSYFTAGAFRTVHSGLADLLPLVNNVDPETASKIDMAPYTTANFSNDLHRMTSERTDPVLSKILVNDSNEVVKWLAENGVRFQLSFNRQAYEVDGRIQFWGGMALKTEDGGKGLVLDHMRKANELGVDVLFSTPATRLVTSSAGVVTSVMVFHEGEEREIRTKAVILAAGGFESNPRMRAQFLGPHWDMALVRGTPYNTGDMLEIAVRDVSAKQVGNWSGCHCVAWDANAPADAGDREISNEFTKSGYPLGIMVNRSGERFVDEGKDMRNYTYAMVGREILKQSGHVAFQIWDSRTISWLREEEYRPEVVERITADSIEELADECAKHGLENKEQFVRTISEFNRAVSSNETSQWNPAVKDALSTTGLATPKSNWALPIDKPPFLAVKVSAGITFTFGGLGVNSETAAVVSSKTGSEVPGLYCVGEMLGGLFYDNYPGGSGLTSGAVFGRRAGRDAARFACGME